MADYHSPYCSVQFLGSIITSTIITSNKAFSDWTELFQDPVIVTAFLDRLLHHSVVINIRGNSYRLRGKAGKEGVEMGQS